MDDTTSAVIAILFALVGFCAVLLPLGAFFIYVGFQTSKRTKIRQRILASNPGAGQHFQVRYASKDRFDAFWKVFPWDSAGVIFRAPQGLVFVGEHLSGTPLMFQFRDEDVQWIGRAPWPNGAVTWFSVSAPGTTHYFTSETGFFIVGSKKGTRQIFDELAGARGQLQS